MNDLNDDNKKSYDRRKSVRTSDIAKKVLEEIEASKEKLRKKKQNNEKDPDK